jgi:hypothetical protein
MRRWSALYLFRPDTCMSSPTKTDPSLYYLSHRQRIDPLTFASVTDVLNVGQAVPNVHIGSNHIAWGLSAPSTSAPGAAERAMVATRTISWVIRYARKGRTHAYRDL